MPPSSSQCPHSPPLLRQGFSPWSGGSQSGAYTPATRPVWRRFGSPKLGDDAPRPARVDDVVECVRDHVRCRAIDGPPDGILGAEVLRTTTSLTWRPPDASTPGTSARSPKLSFTQTTATQEALIRSNLSNQTALNLPNGTAPGSTTTVGLRAPTRDIDSDGPPNVTLPAPLPHDHTSTHEARTGRGSLRDAAREIVARSREEQGLPRAISDPAVIGRLAVLVRAMTTEATR